LSFEDKNKYTMRGTQFQHVFYGK